MTRFTSSVSFAVFLLGRHAVAGSPRCRVIPGDDGWPVQVDWDGLNKTVGGRLIATAPIASVCHEPSYDKVACEALRGDWGNTGTQ